MQIEAEFTPIDMEKWPMAQGFYYYTQMAPTSYTINVTIDVTNTRRALKDKGLKFFPAYLYLVTGAIMKHKELRTAVKDGTLGYWNTLTPAYPQFHEDDKTTSLLFTQYDDDFTSFHKAYIEDTEKYGGTHGILSAKGLPLPNSYIISCIPWIKFNSFSLHNHGIKDYYLPSFEAGGFTEAGGRTLMPLSITVHHATTDGYHVKEFLDELQKSMNEPEIWLRGQKG
ncbi:MAG: CatA-like O-acetyltransferase [Eubacteriales bacterium]|nr:CatA-like O-acetyltransferase [Eubacteriales bacterium]MDD3882662.1 CatA-like O-acetyltransferase [Eubacteriales bacterium]MDD4512766.1 CatA-like O-acetyltransferase [Eubacteriales bacterium]